MPEATRVALADGSLVGPDNPLPTTSGGGGASALTDTQLRATPVPISGSVKPVMALGGNTSVTTVASATYTAFASQACSQLTIVNDSAKVLEVQQGAVGVGLRVPAGASFPFYGITNANQLGVRTTDSTTVTVTARWES